MQAFFQLQVSYAPLDYPKPQTKHSSYLYIGGGEFSFTPFLFNLSGNLPF